MKISNFLNEIEYTSNNSFIKETNKPQKKKKSEAEILFPIDKVFENKSGDIFKVIGYTKNGVRFLKTSKDSGKETHANYILDNLKKYLDSAALFPLKETKKQDPKKKEKKDPNIFYHNTMEDFLSDVDRSYSKGLFRFEMQPSGEIRYIIDKENLPSDFLMYKDELFKPKYFDGLENIDINLKNKTISRGVLVRSGSDVEIKQKAKIYNLGSVVSDDDDDETYSSRSKEKPISLWWKKKPEKEEENKNQPSSQVATQGEPQSPTQGEPQSQPQVVTQTTPSFSQSNTNLNYEYVPSDSPATLGSKSKYYDYNTNVNVKPIKYYSTSTLGEQKIIEATLTAPAAPAATSSSPSSTSTTTSTSGTPPSNAPIVVNDDDDTEGLLELDNDFYQKYLKLKKDKRFEYDMIANEVFLTSLSENDGNLKNFALSTYIKDSKLGSNIIKYYALKDEKAKGVINAKINEIFFLFISNTLFKDKSIYKRSYISGSPRLDKVMIDFIVVLIKKDAAGDNLPDDVFKISVNYTETINNVFSTLESQFKEKLDDKINENTYHLNTNFINEANPVIDTIDRETKSVVKVFNKAKLLQAIDYLLRPNVPNKVFERTMHLVRTKLASFNKNDYQLLFEKGGGKFTVVLTDVLIERMKEFFNSIEYADDNLKTFVAHMVESLDRVKGIKPELNKQISVFLKERVKKIAKTATGKFFNKMLGLEEEDFAGEETEDSLPENVFAHLRVTGNTVYLGLFREELITAYSLNKNLNINNYEFSFIKLKAADSGSLKYKNRSSDKEKDFFEDLEKKASFLKIVKFDTGDYKMGTVLSKIVASLIMNKKNIQRNKEVVIVSSNFRLNNNYFENILEKNQDARSFTNKYVMKSKGLYYNITGIVKQTNISLDKKLGNKINSFKDFIEEQML
jgi:hypothetical protein